MKISEASEILKESFQPNHVQCDEDPALQPRREENSSIRLRMQPIAAPPLIVPPSFSNPSLSKEIVFSQLKPVFTLPPIEPFNLFEHLPKDLITPSCLQNSPERIVPTFLPEALTPFASSISPNPAPFSETRYFHPLLPASLQERTPAPQTFKPQILSRLPEFPTLDELETSSYSDFFDIEIVVSPLENDEGYVFALTLVPHSDLDLPKIRQHYSFLIDKSNSIQKERLSAVKHAVLKALEELDLEDSFNLIAFDSKIEKMSPAPIPATSSALARARAFLEEIQLGSFFSSTNLCKPLLLTIPQTQDEGMHTAILFSDGDPLNKKISQRELALDWTAYNQGRVHLFAIGVGEDPHLATLDAVTAFNRGKIFYPPTRKGIKRKLLKLIKTIGYPVAKNMSATAVSRSAAKITLYPKQKQMPALYLNVPYVILGTTDKLDDFILFVQGKLKNQWLNIKKKISFVNAKKGESSLKAEWALQQAYILYEKYLYDLDTKYLVEAKNILESHDLQAAFQ